MRPVIFWGTQLKSYSCAGKYPKMERVAKEVAAFPAVATFLAASEHKTLKADPFGMMPAEYASS